MTYLKYMSEWSEPRPDKAPESLTSWSDSDTRAPHCHSTVSQHTGTGTKHICPGPGDQNGQISKYYKHSDRAQETMETFLSSVDLHF